MKKPVRVFLCLCLCMFFLFGCIETSMNGSEQTAPSDQNTTMGSAVAGPYVDSVNADVHSFRVVLDQDTRYYKLFEIDVATDEQFANIVASNLYDFEITTFYDLIPNTTYYVRTRGYNGTQYSAYSETYTVSTNACPVETLSLDNAQLDLFVGDTYQLNAEVLPSDASDKTVTWVSYDESVATVSENGTITATGLGNTVIIASSVNEIRDVCAVHVGKKTITNVIETLLIDESTLNGNAVFGRYYTFGGSVEKNCNFDGDYHLNSFAAENILIGNSYFFGGLSKEVNVDGILFNYTWTVDSGYDFDGKDCALVSDSQSNQTIKFIGAGAYEKIYLLSLADDYIWNDTFKSSAHWELSNGDIVAEVTITYKDNTTETKTVNFGNMMKYNAEVPSYDQYILTSNTARLVDDTIGAESAAPYMYAIPVDANPNKQIVSLTLNLENTDAKRKVNLAVFAVSGIISDSAPDPVEEGDITVSKLDEYEFNLIWTNKENADGYYVSIYEDDECTTPVYVMVYSSKVYLSQVILYTNSCGFNNNVYPAGKTYYVKISSFNEYGSSLSNVIPITTLGTYPREIRLKMQDTPMTNKEAELAIGESLSLNVYFPTTSYYTYSDITWTVSDGDVLRVIDGKVTGTSAGTATVRASLTQYPDIYAECTITVTGYGDGWIGYDNGIFMDNQYYFNIDNYLFAEMTCSAIRITDEQMTDGRILDKIQYYVSVVDTVYYEFYLLDEGQSLFTQKNVASGEVPATKIGWSTVELENEIEVPIGKELWIVIISYDISRADNNDENGSWGLIDSCWVQYDNINISGTLMLRAHFSNEK